MKKTLIGFWTILMLLTFTACGLSQVSNESPTPSQNQSLQGKFVGFADSRVVEIIVDGEPRTFKVGENIRSDIEELEIDHTSEVSFEIKEISEKNYEIITIEKVK